MTNQSNRINYTTVTIHVMAWLLIFLLPYIINTEYGHKEDADELAFTNLKFASNFYWIAIFYFNAFVLVPKLFNSGKYIFYALSLLLLFCALMLLHRVFFNVLVTGHKFIFLNSAYHNIIPVLFTVLTSTVYKITIDKTKADKAAAELQKETLKTELSFLRSQISPHFLFNVFNNIVAMTRLKSDLLEPTVVKLSSLLQYMVYETDAENVLLKSELEYLDSYIELQQQRFGKKLKLTIEKNIAEPWQSIAPMLLIPFVENAFKHGTSLPDPEIIIRINQHGEKFEFVVRNKFQHSDIQKDKNSGVGLANVKRRLELLYGPQHTLNIQQQDGWFTVLLTLKFRS
ncbi:histidine kinase [soil metagenome]